MLSSQDFEDSVDIAMLSCGGCGATSAELDVTMHVFANGNGDQRAWCENCLRTASRDSPTEDERSDLPEKERLELVADVDGWGVHDRRSSECR